MTRTARVTTKTRVTGKNNRTTRQPLQTDRHSPLPGFFWAIAWYGDHRAGQWAASNKQTTFSQHGQKTQYNNRSTRQQRLINSASTPHQLRINSALTPLWVHLAGRISGDMKPVSLVRKRVKEKVD